MSDLELLTQAAIVAWVYVYVGPLLWGDDW
jgi:hypothetical protein